MGNKNTKKDLHEDKNSALRDEAIDTFLHIMTCLVIMLVIVIAGPRTFNRFWIAAEYVGFTLIFIYMILWKDVFKHSRKIKDAPFNTIILLGFLVYMGLNIYEIFSLKDYSSSGVVGILNLTLKEAILTCIIYATLRFRGDTD